LKQTRVYQEALEEGKAEGKQEGKAEATRKFALKLLRTGMSLEQIAEITELSLQQIQALQKEIQES
jgi:predicted transposase/invertase (TIGR01784 family)